jgi:large subunit ribosomal protein L21
MSMYAVLKTGGKQYRVEAGATLVVEKLEGEPGSAITFDRVLLVGDGEQVTVGTPTVPGASVSATVLGAELGQKIIVFKFKPKVKYRRRTGHRQRLTLIRIDAISADGKRVTAEPPAKADKPAEAEKPAKTDKSARASKATKAVAAAKGEAASTTTEPAAVAATAPAKRRPSRAATTAEGASQAPPAAKPRARRAASADAAGATSSAPKPTRRRAAPKADAAESVDKADGTEPAEQAEKE